MTTSEAEKNAADLNAIYAAGVTYTIRKYAGAWVPVVYANGKRHSFCHCRTSGGAMAIAIDRGAAIAREFLAEKNKSKKDLPK
jgi:saccharopine dehydrogenase-like NADP-dependent oxidoreductase